MGEKRGIAIMRVFQDVRLLGEKGNMIILRVRNDVITGSEGDKAIMRVPKNVAYLKEKWRHLN